MICKNRPSKFKKRTPERRVEVQTMGKKQRKQPSHISKQRDKRIIKSTKNSRVGMSLDWGKHFSSKHLKTFCS